MPSPFPGMDPYLEHPEIWPEVHHLLISEMIRLLAPQLRPKYKVAVEIRTYESESPDQDKSLLVGVPDLSIKRQLTRSNTRRQGENMAVLERPIQPLSVRLPVPEIRKEGYLEIRQIGSGDVVTAIELLSPTNKRGEGRKFYQKKRRQVLGSDTNLVEIDLLRIGQPMPLEGLAINSDYRILIARASQFPQGDLYAFNIRDKMPIFPLPLRPEDTEPIIDLKPLLASVYDLASYDLVIDYTQNTVPPLSEDDREWIESLLQQQQSI